MDIHDIIRGRHICPSAWAVSNLLPRVEEERGRKERRERRFLSSEEEMIRTLEGLKTVCAPPIFL